MNEKSVIAVLLIVLLAAVSVLGLPFMVDRMELNAETIIPMVTVTPLPNDDYESLESIAFLFIRN